MNSEQELLTTLRSALRAFIDPETQEQSAVGQVVREMKGAAKQPHQAPARLLRLLPSVLEVRDPLSRDAALWVWAAYGADLFHRGILIEGDPVHARIAGVGFGVSTVLWIEFPWGAVLAEYYAKALGVSAGGIVRDKGCLEDVRSVVRRVLFDAKPVPHAGVWDSAAVLLMFPGLPLAALAWAAIKYGNFTAGADRATSEWLLERALKKVPERHQPPPSPKAPTIRRKPGG